MTDYFSNALGGVRVGHVELLRSLLEDLRAMAVSAKAAGCSIGFMLSD